MKLKLFWWLNYIVSFGLILSYLSSLIPPSKLKYLPLFGLTYPVWMLLNFFFVFFYLLTKYKKKALLSAGTIILGLVLGLHGTFYQMGNKSVDQNQDNTLKVMTYNVRSFDRYNLVEGNDTESKIFSLIKTQHADLMCFQEFFNSDKSKNGKRIKDATQAKFIHEGYTHHMTGGKYFGLVTVSKYPIVSKGEIKFDNDDNNSCIYSDLVIGEDTVRVFNAHLASIRFNKEDYKFIENQNTNSDLSEDYRRIGSMLIHAFEKREVQAKKVNKYINESPYPVILCGDFNDSPISYCYNTLTDGLIDAFTEKGKGTGSTYIGKFPSFRIDYILHSEEFLCSSYQVIQEELSDHKPVVVEFTRE